MIGRSIHTIYSPFVWTKRMLNALSNGVKRGTWYSLYDKVFTKTNLRESALSVIDNKGSHGVDQVSVSRYESHLSHNLNILQAKLKNSSYEHDLFVGSTFQSRNR